MDETIIKSKEESAKIIQSAIKILSVKHDVEPKNIMLGFIENNCNELYVWDWNSGRSQSDQFKTLEIIELSKL